MEGSNQTSNHFPRYITIAMDIGERMVRGEYKEGQKISGRSTLAGLYNVSPETVRRALTLLQEAGMVRVVPGAGVFVHSIEAAREYLAESGQYKAIKEMQERLSRLVVQRNKLNAEIEHLTAELLEYVLSILSTKHRI